MYAVTNQCTRFLLGLQQFVFWHFAPLRKHETHAWMIFWTYIMSLATSVALYLFVDLSICLFICLSIYCIYIYHISIIYWHHYTSIYSTSIYFTIHVHPPRPYLTKSKKTQLCGSQPKHRSLYTTYYFFDISDETHGFPGCTLVEAAARSKAATKSGIHGSVFAHEERAPFCCFSYLPWNKHSPWKWASSIGK